MSAAIEKHIERVKRDYLKQFKFEVSAFSILAVAILLCSCLFLISSLKTDRLSRMVKFETDIENRVLFQKSVATNLANLITKRSIQTKPKEIHKLLIQHFFLIKDGSIGTDHFVIKWIGREPNGVEIDQFGIKGNNAIKRYDQVYSEQDIIKIVDSSGISHLMHQTCVAVLSGSGASVGNICIHQSINSMLSLAPLSDIKFVSLHEEVDIGSFNTQNPYGLITLLERTPNVFLGKIKAISVISHYNLALLWLESIWISLLVTLITGIVVIAKNYLSHKKTSKTLNLIAKQTEFIEKSTTAAIELQHDHMTKLQNLLFRTQGSIKLFMNKSQMAQDGMKLLSKLASDLICPYFASSDIKLIDAKLLEDAAKNVISVFMVAIEEMKCDVHCQVNPTIKKLGVDLIFFSRIIGCLINSSLEVLQNSGKVEIVISCLENDTGSFLQIVLQDNCFGMPDKAKLVPYACIFPTIEEICAELIILGGSISSTTQNYEGRIISIMMPVNYNKTPKNNVVSIWDIEKEHA